MPDREPEARARRALAANAATRELAAAPFRRLTGGISNSTWCASLGSERFFVRLSGEDDASLGVDRASEAALLGLASEAGLSPPLVACDPSRRLLVTRYIEGRPWSREEARSADGVVRIATVLRRLHALPPPRELAPVSFALQAARYEAELSAEGLPPEPRLAAAATAALARLAAGAERRCPCHNDVHHDNVVDDGERLWLVDWEYGGLGDPVFDLAGFASHHVLDRERSAQLLDACAADVAPSEFDDARWVYDYVQWLWYRVAAHEGVRHGPALEVRARDLYQSLVARA
jgi:thiamine kinase-like enzyme